MTENASHPMSTLDPVVGADETHAAGHSMARTSRRVFIRLSDVPALLTDTLRGEPVALRRVLGARRTGRIGVLMALVAWGAATEPRYMIEIALAHVLASSVIGYRTAPRRGLGPRQHQRLVLWFVAPFLFVVAPLRWVMTESWIPPLVALVGAHLLLAVYLLRSRPLGPSATDPIGETSAQR